MDGAFKYCGSSNKQGCFLDGRPKRPDEALSHGAQRANCPDDRKIATKSLPGRKKTIKSVGYREKENGQTVISDDLSALAPLMPQLLNLWEDFKKVVEFIDKNSTWLRVLMTVAGKMA